MIKILKKDVNNKLKRAILHLALFVHLLQHARTQLKVHEIPFQSNLSWLEFDLIARLFVFSSNRKVALYLKEDSVVIVKPPNMFKTAR